MPPAAADSAAPASCGYEIVRAQPEHLEAILKLYRETSAFHEDMDPHYYVRAAVACLPVAHSAALCTARCSRRWHR